MSKPAATLSHHHCCPMFTGNTPHVGGPIIQGSPNIFIEGMLAARVGDKCHCNASPPDTIVNGSSGVFFNGMPAARLGDRTAHGGIIVKGARSVLIGGSENCFSDPLPPFDGISQHLPIAPTRLEKAIEQLEEAHYQVLQCLYNNLPLPESPYRTVDKMQVVEQTLNERFIVRITETRYAKDTDHIGPPPTETIIGGKPKKVSTYWTTTFTQMVHAGKDAKQICKTVGKPFKPNAEYTLLIIDQIKAARHGDVKSFIPTYNNLKDFVREQMPDELIKEHGHDLMDAVLSEGTSAFYEMWIDEMNQQGLNIWEDKHIEEIKDYLSMNETQRKLFQQRIDLEKRLGANKEFLGNGMTNNTTDNFNGAATPFGTPYNSPRYGVVETFSYDKNPQTLGKLTQKGIVTRIPLETINHTENPHG